MSSLAIAYLTSLIEHPVRTKAITSGTLNAFSELLAGVISGEKDPETGTYFGSRLIKMSVYGLLISGPVSHYLVDIVQRAFRKSKRGVMTNLAQILALNLFVAPIMSVLYISYLSVLAGARTFEEVKDRVCASIMTVLRSQWITSPILIAIVQKYVPKIAWTPVFSFFGFILSTYHNILVRQRLAENKKKRD